MWPCARYQIHPATHALRRCATLLFLVAGVPAAARTVPVSSSSALASAIGAAQPGDDIVLADGSYRIRHQLLAWFTATPEAPITVRAAHKLAAHIHVSGVIGFEVTGANWHFDGLDIDGDCLEDTDCEHAFHVVANADGFHLTNSRLVDFNAQLKVNTDSSHHLPAGGLVENNEFFDSHPRDTDNPVAPLDIDVTDGWVIRGNLVHDFQKSGGGENSYGLFVNGGSRKPILERNLIECASGAAPMGRMVGLSFGAHGMNPALCAPHFTSTKACDPEVTGGIIRNNIIGNCTGEGIYLNKARDTHVLFNTVIQTGGILFRYPSSTGVAQGNLMTGEIATADGGQVTDQGNVTGLPDEPAVAHWKDTHGATEPPGPAAFITDDYCGRPRGARWLQGALQSADCPVLHWARPKAAR